MDINPVLILDLKGDNVRDSCELLIAHIFLLLLLTLQIYQDEKPFLEQAKLEREQQQKADVGYKKFATIPDIVAIEIKEKHGIDIHAPETIGDKTEMAKFMVIVKQEYPYLLSY